jgi:tetratricopeptide (TPR) repeat protein
MKALLFLPFIALTVAGTPAELGDSLVAAFDNAAAAAAFQEALAEHPDDFPLRCRHLRALIDAGEDAQGDEARRWFIRARDEAQRLVDQFPDRALSHHYDAVASGRYAQFAGGKEKVRHAERVRGSAEKALELDSSNAESWLTLGNYYYEVATLNRALRFFARTFFGASLQGGLPEAEEALAEALRLDPTHIYAHLILARVRWEQKDWEACTELCSRIGMLPVRDHLDPRSKAEATKLREKAGKKLGKLKQRR